MQPIDSLGAIRDIECMLAKPHRRQVLTWFGVAACMPVVGCTDSTDTVAGLDTAGGDSTSGETCSAIPQEGDGPYPGDGSDGPNVLTLEDVVRSDIRKSIGTLSGKADGIRLQIKLRIVDGNCAPLVGYAVYLWHCDRDGKYSLYTLTTENYLRGVQVTDAEGWVTFKSIFPACYPGRWPHIHVEVFSDLASISNASNAVVTSQLALPEAQCSEVFATSGYEDSVQNLAETSLASDVAFSDGAEAETPAMSGSVDDGFVATLTIGVGI